MKKQLAALASTTQAALALAEALLASDDDLLLVLDEQLQVLLAGPGVEAVLGQPSGTLARRPLAETGLFVPSAAALQAALRAALAGVPVAPMELEHARTD